MFHFKNGDRNYSAGLKEQQFPCGNFNEKKPMTEQKPKNKHPVIKAIALAICAYLLGSLTNSIVIAI